MSVVLRIWLQIFKEFFEKLLKRTLRIPTSLKTADSIQGSLFFFSLKKKAYELETRLQFSGSSSGGFGFDSQRPHSDSRSDVIFSLLPVPGTHTVLRHTCKQNTQSHWNKTFKRVMTHTCNQHSGGRSSQSYIVRPCLKNQKWGGKKSPAFRYTVGWSLAKTYTEWRVSGGKSEFSTADDPRSVLMTGLNERTMPRNSLSWFCCTPHHWWSVLAVVVNWVPLQCYFW